MTEPQLLILNGPGFNYSGADQLICSLADIKDQCVQCCTEHGLKLDFRQTDDIKQLLDWIGAEAINSDAMIINPGINFQASHQVAAAVDNLAGIYIPIVEVHLNNILNQPQENTPLNITKRKTSFVGGLGIFSYVLAINSIAQSIKELA